MLAIVVWFGMVRHGLAKAKCVCVGRNIMVGWLLVSFLIFTEGKTSNTSGQESQTIAALEIVRNFYDTVPFCRSNQCKKLNLVNIQHNVWKYFPCTKLFNYYYYNYPIVIPKPLPS